MQGSVHSAFLYIVDYLLEVEKMSKNNEDYKEMCVKQQCR